MAKRVTVDTSGAETALSRAAETIAERVDAAAEVSASAVVREAKGRVARRTGETAAGIGYIRANAGGWLVHAVNPKTPMLPYWLEKGTRYMSAKPFLYASAALELGAHRRRIEEAVGDGIDAAGLGE